MSEYVECTHWNYRIIWGADDNPDTDPFYTINEVYYNGETIIAWTAEPTSPMGESLDELKKDLANYMKALERPVLCVVDNKLQEKEDV